MAGKKDIAVKNLKKAQRKTRKGIPNKRTSDVLAIINRVDGNLTKAKQGLLHQAKDDPKWFYDKIWSKIIPKDIQVDLDLSKGIAEMVYGYLSKDK